MSLSSAQPSDSPRYPGPSTEELRAKLHLERVTDGLAELYQLLEDFGPAWYQENHHDRALSALLLVKKLPEAE